MDKPRAWTTDEVREKFIEHCLHMAKYWAEVKDPARIGSESEVHARCEGVVFSILSALDGCNAALPGFIVAPDPHPDDTDFNISQGNNYYPRSEPSANDIAGSMHELISKVKKKEVAG